jgi:hypothetical protein
MEEERKSDTAETFGSQDAPGTASNQNAEEPSTPEGGGSSRRGGESEGDGEGDGDARRRGASAGIDGEERPGNPGGAGEHSQATGHPSNAG